MITALAYMAAYIPYFVVQIVRATNGAQVSPVAIFPPRRSYSTAGTDFRPVLCRILGIERNQPGIIDPAIAIFKCGMEAGLQRAA